MNPLTQFKKILILPLLIAASLVIGQAHMFDRGCLPATPVIYWSNQVWYVIAPTQRGPRELRE